MKKSLTDKQSAAPSCQMKTTIGGQALIEGLMMIGPDKKVMAVRKPDGSIYLEELPMTRWTGLANLLFVRGSVRLFRQLVTGTRALLRSAELLDEASEPVQPATPAALAGSMEGAAGGEAAAGTVLETEPEAKPRRRTFKEWRAGIDQKIDHFLTHHSEVMLYLSAIGGILFSVVLFILLPNLLAGGVSQLTGIGDTASRSSAILKNLIEGLIRIVIFVGYLILASRMSEIQRVWMYHGAEHKTIACYEAQMPLTVDNARQFSRFHPRCGTSFMFIVILVSIVVFSLVGWWNPWINLLIRFLLVPFVAGIAYEIIRLAGRYNNPVTRAISVPGLWLQRLTTAEPNDTMLEVAIAAMEAVIPEESGRDKW
jgi:uncharacterized protein YqhQ